MNVLRNILKDSPYFGLAGAETAPVIGREPIRQTDIDDRAPRAASLAPGGQRKRGAPLPITVVLPKGSTQKMVQPCSLRYNQEPNESHT